VVIKMATVGVGVAGMIMSTNAIRSDLNCDVLRPRVKVHDVESKRGGGGVESGRSFDAFRAFGEDGGAFVLAFGLDSEETVPWTKEFAVVSEPPKKSCGVVRASRYVYVYRSLLQVLSLVVVTWGELERSALHVEEQVPINKPRRARVEIRSDAGSPHSAIRKVKAWQGRGNRCIPTKN